MIAYLNMNGSARFAPPSALPQRANLNILEWGIVQVQVQVTEDRP
jgi:hypothetical protein